MPSALAVSAPLAEGKDGFGCDHDVLTLVHRFRRRGDILKLVSESGGQALLECRRLQSATEYWLYATAVYFAQPKQTENIGYFFRASLHSSDGIKSLVVSGDAIRRYFYQLDLEEGSLNLYELLEAPESATQADLRVAWRIKQLATEKCTVKRQNERAFNIVAKPDLRQCYDALRRDENAPPVFPYAGSGSILVEGDLSTERETFFAHRILTYKPDLRPKRTSLLVRQCEFLADHVVCRDTRRKIEISLDGNLLPSLNWDLTWNHWKHWLKSRIQVDATFVHTTKDRFQNGRWIPLNWYTALPSRLRVTIPTDVGEDIQRARTIHGLLGEHADLVARIRAEVQEQPVEHSQIQEWFDHLGASTHLKPQHVTWRPDYEPYYFDQLRKGATTWFLFRDEYLFIWATVVISEIPQAGHVTYTFAKPADLDDFLRRYARVTRQDVRRNRHNAATELGFVGRIVRGTRKKRWLMDVLRQAGEGADYMEVLE
jgi:hypothetical protein